MANYQKYSDADFARFEPRASAYNQNAAQKIEPLLPFEEQTKPQMELVRRKKKTVAEAKREMRVGALQTAKILVIALCLLSMFAALLYSRLRADELQREIDAANAQLKVEQGENVRLNMQLDSMISLEKVENYARDELGMTKVEGYQIEYIDLSGADTVTVSGNKSVKSLSAEGPLQKLSEYLKGE